MFRRRVVRVMKSPQNEAQLQKYIMDAAKKAGLLCYKFTSPANRGRFDLLLIAKGGQCAFVEVKHPNGRGVLSPLQEREQGLLSKHKVSNWVCQDVRIAESIIELVRDQEV